MKAEQIKIYCLTKPSRVKNENKMMIKFMYLMVFQGMCQLTPNIVHFKILVFRLNCLYQKQYD